MNNRMSHPETARRQIERSLSMRLWRGFGLWMASLAVLLVAACGGGGGGSSEPAAVPGMPTMVSATAGDAETTITWAAVAGATSYNIYRSKTPGSHGTKVGASSTTSSRSAR